MKSYFGHVAIEYSQILCSPTLHRVSSSSRPPAAAALHSSLPSQLTLGLGQEGSLCSQAEASQWISWPWPLSFHRRAVKNNSLLCFPHQLSPVGANCQCLIFTRFQALNLRSSQVLPVLWWYSRKTPKTILCSSVMPGCPLEIMVPLGALTRWEVTASESILSMDMTWEFCDKTQPGNWSKTI